MSRIRLLFPQLNVIVHVIVHVIPKGGFPSNPRNGQGGRRIQGIMQETT